MKLGNAPRQNIALILLVAQYLIKIYKEEVFTKNIFNVKFVLMNLFIDTTDKNFLILALRDKGRVLSSKQIKTNFNQSEKLWPALDKLLKEKKIKPTALKKIIVGNGQGSFTSLRIGIAAANALAFAWGIKVEDSSCKFKRSGKLQIVEPRYNGEANIS